MFFWPEVVWILSPSLWPQSHWACKHMTGYPWLMEIYLEHFFFYKCVASTFRTNIVWLLLMNFQGNNLLKSQFLMWLNPVVKAHMYLVICIINRWHFNVCISIYRTTFFFRQTGLTLLRFSGRTSESSHVPIISDAFTQNIVYQPTTRAPLMFYSQGQSDNIIYVWKFCKSFFVLEINWESDSSKSPNTFDSQQSTFYLLIQDKTHAIAASYSIYCPPPKRSALHHLELATQPPGWHHGDWYWTEAFPSSGLDLEWFCCFFVQFSKKLPEYF